jgi:hypothetical protein
MYRAGDASFRLSRSTGVHTLSISTSAQVDHPQTALMYGRTRDNAPVLVLRTSPSASGNLHSSALRHRDCSSATDAVRCQFLKSNNQRVACIFLCAALALIDEKRLPIFVQFRSGVYGTCRRWRIYIDDKLKPFGERAMTSAGKGSKPMCHDHCVELSRDDISISLPRGRIVPVVASIHSQSPGFPNSQ